MPAAAVIPAPIAYIKVVAVKKLVVGFRGSPGWSVARRVLVGRPSSRKPRLLFTVVVGEFGTRVYFEKIRVFQGRPSPEYISME